MKITSRIEQPTVYASEAELKFLLDIMQEEACSRVLEIGSKYGRMLLRWIEVLPKGSRICSIDLPGGDWGNKDSGPILEAVINYLRDEAFDAHLFRGNSHGLDAIKWARELGPYDLIFIDADHTCEAVMQDWKNYAGMASLVAFHDVSIGVSGKVREAYDKLCVGYHHKEYFENKRTPGMGVIWT